MLSDLDQLLHARDIDAVIVPMHEHMHASFRWLSRGAKVTKGYAIKVRDRAPVLVTYPMERDEAIASGLDVRLVHEFESPRSFASPVEAYAEMFTNILRAFDSGPTIAFFGNVPVQLYVDVVEAMER